MGKLITESDVRELVKDGKLDKHQSFLLPRGTILTPSARSFLIDRQIKISDVDKKFSKNERVVQKQPLFTSNLVSLNIDFEHLDKLQIPILRLKNQLKEQTIILIKAFGLCANYDNHSSDVQLIVRFVNGILAANFYEYENAKILDKIDISKFNFDNLDDEIVCLLNQSQTLVVKIAISLRAIKNFYPDLNSLDSVKDIVEWQNEIQKWTADILGVNAKEDKG